MCASIATWIGWGEEGANFMRVTRNIVPVCDECMMGDIGTG